MGLILKIENGKGFSLNYHERRVEVTLIRTYRKGSVFEISLGHNDRFPITIVNDVPYRIEEFPETTFTSRAHHRYANVNLNAPLKVKILRLEAEKKASGRV